MLSADDSISLNGANGVNSLMPDREFTYSERSNCGNGKPNFPILPVAFNLFPLK